MTDLFNDSPDSTPAPTLIRHQTPGILVMSTGDVNGDGTIDILDALLIARYSVGLDPANFIPENTDTNCDESIDIVDALLVAQYYVRLISAFC